MNVADINAEARSLCDADTTSYTAADLLRRLNIAYEKVVGWLINVDGTWQFDDTNFTTTPRGYNTLISGQHGYTFSDKFLQIEEVDILDLNGRYIRLEPFDANEKGVSFEEYFGITSSGGVYTAVAGFPNYYDKVGNVIYFDKAPTASYATLTNGIRVTFKRTADLFTSAQVTTGTKEPGFDSNYHYILPYMMAIPFCMTYKPNRVAEYERVVGDTEPATGAKKGLLKFYSKKEQDKRFIMRPKKINYI